MNQQHTNLNNGLSVNIELIGEDGSPDLRRQTTKKRTDLKHHSLKINKSEQQRQRETTSQKFKKIYSLCCSKIISTQKKKLAKIECNNSRIPILLEESQNQKVQQQKLTNLLGKLTKKQRIEKAERHIYDAIYLRTVRNDIDQYQRRFLRICWNIVNNENWNYFLWLLAVIYQIITFFEPAHTQVQYEFQFFKKIELKNQKSHEVLMNIEITILMIWFIDIAMCLGLLFSLPKGLMKINLKMILKLIFFGNLIGDFIWFFTSYPNPTPRFGRYARPLMMIPYSKDLRRNLLGIIKTSKDLIILFILYFVVMSLFAFIGINLLTNEIQTLDRNVQDYNDFFKLLFMLFALSTLDFYPDIMVPPYLVGKFYTIFFIPFLFLYVFLFLPIPLAVVYEGFRQDRVKIAMDDIFKQKSALFTSFLCLDYQNKGYLTYQQLEAFIRQLYRDQLQDEDIWEFIDGINKDFNDKIQIEEFFQIIEIIESKEAFHLPVVVPLQIWEKFRTFCLEKLNLLQIVMGDIFNMIMIFITILNCVLILIAFFIADEGILSVFDLIDNIFLGIYILECLVKIIALGLKNYFDDSWNIFDFSLIIFQILFDYVLYTIVSGILVQSLKANRVFRIAKIQKVFRMFRALRSIKIVGFFFSGLEILDNVKNLIYKIMICVPVILRLLIPIQIIFYLYATLGIQIFGGITTSNVYSPQNCSLNGDTLFYDWSSCQYMDFESYYGAYLLLIQVFIAAEWSTIVFDLSYRMNNFALPAFFLGSFVFLSIFLQALLGGLVWEVFNVVSYSLKVNEEEEQKIQKKVLQNYNDQLVLEDVNPREIQKNINESPEKNRKQRILKTFLKGSSQNALVLIDDNPNKLEVIRTIEFKQRQRFFVHQDSELENMNNGKRLSLIQHKQILPHHNQIRPKHLDEDEEIILNQKGEIFTFRKKTFNLSRKIYLEEFLLVEDFKNQKNQLFMFDGDKKLATDYVNHLRNDIKNQELIKKAKDVNLQNHNQLLNHAILRNNQIVENINERESIFLSEIYGGQFQKLKDLKFKGQFKIESSALFSLLGILKFPDILYIVEQKLTLQLLPTGSIWKFIHQLSDRSWCMIEMDGGIVNFIPLEQGPWTYSREMFAEHSQSEIRICEKITFVNFYRDFDQLTKFHKFKESLVKMARQFQIGFQELQNDSCCIVYNIRNHGFQRGDITAKQEESSNMTKSQIQEVMKTWILVLAKNQGDAQSVYSNQLHLIQFLRDIGNIIKTYEDNWFKKLNDLFELQKEEDEII